MPTYESLPAQSQYFKGNLFQKMVDDLRLAEKTKRTVYGYGLQTSDESRNQRGQPV